MPNALQADISGRSSHDVYNAIQLRSVAAECGGQRERDALNGAFKNAWYSEVSKDVPCKIKPKKSHI